NDDQIRRLQASGFFVEIVITGVYPGNAIVWLLKQLLNTRHGCVEHIGDVLRPFVFVCTTFGNFEDAGFSKVQQIFTGTPLWIKTGLGNLIRNGDHLTDNGTFAHDI
ncbi:hypothetical protein AAIH54_33890, partial [Pseudomonas aeruginosa]|uniref:hypothetical protein n=1 Tax=Pseudomonas aeruginosa TaxID=287 RepID=UPI0031B6A5EA